MVGSANPGCICQPRIGRKNLNYRVVILRVDYKGDLLPEVVMGTQWRQGQPTLWTMIWKGHMTLMIPPSLEEAQALIQIQDVYITPCLGFPYFWHQRHDQPRTAPGTLACPHCKPPKRAGAAEFETYLRKNSCLAAVALCVAGGKSSPFLVSPSATPAGPSGLVLQEYFAGHGVISAGWAQAGEVRLEPIELYKDPHRRLQPRPDHDLSLPEVQDRCLTAVDNDVSNVEWIAAPCTTFCDWNLQNHGIIRTFENPIGFPQCKGGCGQLLVYLWGHFV